MRLLSLFGGRLGAAGCAPTAVDRGPASRQRDRAELSPRRLFEKLRGCLPASSLFPLILAMVVVTTLSVVAARSAAPALAASTLTRVEDPVVLTGADVPSLTGFAPNLLVAFQHDGSGWVQIPVQVDERDTKDFGVIYNNTPSGVTTLQYTDANTWAGADSNTNIDSNDEIVFMAKDAGGQAPSFSEPAGVVSGTGVEVTVSDPLHPGQTGWVYLWRQAGALDPGAGTAYVVYNFLLDSGDYKTTYQLSDGPNPENSLAFSSAYSYHFGDRWQDDELFVTAGAATGVDILDRHKPMFAPGNCVRTEDTFNDAEGAFVVNKTGPVRAIRSYVGANSGPLTQREHVFYAERQDIRTFLRVHTIPSVMDFFDYSPAASGMTYYNDLNTGGFTIDGVPETPVAGAATWEMVNGAQGAVVHAALVSTNWSGFNYTNYYLDDSSPPVTQCTGDAFAYGSSGAYVNPSGSPQIPNTDPGTGGTTYLNSMRFMYFKAPYGSGATAVAAAQALSSQALTPLTYSIAPFLGGGDTDGDANDNCPSVANAGQENSDANFIDQTPPSTQDDRTWANSDVPGDACDADDDNDGLSDAAEAAGCNGSGPLNALVRDSDGDRFLDGPECTFGTNPASAASKPALSSCGPAGDTDADRIQDRIEVCNYNSNPNDTDTDNDLDGFQTTGLTKDGCEVASLNNDRVVNAGDQLLLVQEILRETTPSLRLVSFDLNKDGAVNAGDQLLMLLFISPSGQCP